MTTITIEKPFGLEKTHFSNLEELYLILQEQIKFENNLQKKAYKAMNIDELELIDI